MRIFQLAQELNINSQEILDALDDMGIQAKSNLAVLEDNVVAELRELFKPKPKSVSRSAKDDAVRKALAEREARDRAARDAARREEERKSAARRTALERAAARRAPGESPLAQNEAVDSRDSRLQNIQTSESRTLRRVRALYPNRLSQRIRPPNEPHRQRMVR